MNKKGAELSMNVIIISILVILVLLVIAFFFLGGTSNLFQKIQSVGPDDLETAVQDCQTKCQLTQSRISNIEQDKKEGNVLITSSSYCRSTFNVDKNGDNIADEKHHCWSSEVGVDCPGVDDFCDVNAFEEL